MNLAYLSLAHCPPRAEVPSPPTPEQRLRAFRELHAPILGNNVFRFPTPTQPALPAKESAP